MGFVKKVLPIAGSVAGGILGGPAGAAIGGALGGALSSGSGAKSQGMYKGYTPDEESYLTTAANQRMLNQGLANQQGFVDQLSGQVDGYDPLVNMLSAQARGEGPSIADMQLKDATNRNLQQQMGQVAATRGVNPMLAARLAAQNMASIGQTAAGQSAQTRLAEMLQAQSQEVAARQAQSGTASMGGGLSSQMRDLSIQQSEADRNAQIERERLMAEQALGGAKINTDRHDANQKRTGDFIAGLGEAAGSLIGAGDDDDTTNLFGGNSAGGAPNSSNSNMAVV